MPYDLFLLHPAPEGQRPRWAYIGFWPSLRLAQETRDEMAQSREGFTHWRLSYVTRSTATYGKVHSEGTYTTKETSDDAR